MVDHFGVGRDASVKLSRIAAGFLLGFLVVSALVGVTARRAEAGVSCSTLGHGVIAIYIGGQSSYGNRADNPGIAVRNSTVNCSRASSLYVSDPDNSDTFVEVGWFDHCGDDDVCAAYCPNVTSPTFL